MDTIDIEQTGYVDHLLECLEDTYECNQKQALQLLKLIPTSSLKTAMSDDKLGVIFEKAIRYLRSSRSHDSQSSAYLMQFLLIQPCSALKAIGSDSDGDLASILMQKILNELGEQATIAAGSLLDASLRAPMYPCLMVLRQLIETYPGFISPDITLEAVRLCRVMCDLVYPVVCNSSPEGCLPETVGDGESESSGLSSSRPGLPQYLVVCCWRTIREISLLYGLLMKTALKDGGTDRSQMTESVRLFYESILMNAKHRGAFEMAYTGYCQYWHTIWRLPTAASFVDEFLSEGPYSSLLSGDKADRLCATRRSAGLPFMILAFLSAEPAVNNYNATHKAMGDLLPTALNEDPAEQNRRVHSLNILRAIYRTSSLAEPVQQHILSGLKAAILGYKSQVWPVRNAATLLFSALITRMFGVKKERDDLSKRSGMAGRLFFQKYPGVHAFLLEEIETCTVFSHSDQTLLQPSLYLLLIILCKLHSTQRDARMEGLSLQPFLPQIIKSAGSPVIKARILAARALTNIISYDEIESTMRLLCDLLVTSQSTNQQHGILLQAKHLLGNIAKLEEAERLVCMSSLDVALIHRKGSVMASHCDVMKSAFIDVLTECHLQGMPINCCLPIDTAWVKDSINLQLSKCRLLIASDWNPDAVVTLLLQPQLYEVHQELLTHVIGFVENGAPLPQQNLVSVFLKWTDDTQSLSHGQLMSISLLCDSLRQSSAAAEKRVIAGCERLLHKGDVCTLPCIQLLTKYQRCESVTLPLLDDLLRQGQLNKSEMHRALNIIEDMKYILPTTTQNRALNTNEDIFWRSLISLILCHDDHVRTEACYVSSRILTAYHKLLQSAMDSHSSINHLIVTILQLYGTPVLTSLHNWQDVTMWRPLDSQQGDDDCLFSKADTSLLCDPDAFFSILQKVVSSR